ncbi:alanine--tRNA ligase [soil metagenome]
MDSKTIRQHFLYFFKSKGHHIVPSAPLVVKDDPTLMFTNAGMNQFKKFFLGINMPQFSRVADTQKCLRVSGKHNDLEEVGIDTYHHTMFEMLGNWSFGNYFKKEAITWAWELLTEIYKLPKDRLYVSVFGGDKSEDLDFDQEAHGLWKGIVAEERIIYGNKKDNFWEMGDTGPCGPSSEIHIDLRSEEEVQKISGRELVNNDHPLVVEIWNLVFIQYNRLASGKLELLPEKHVDTGMGFERLTMAIQNKKSNYDTDVFQPLIKFVAGLAGIEYGKVKEKDIALRVIVDHIRAISFAIADGQLPSNNKAGYVIRRILRRAVRYGYTFLGFNEPFLYKLLPILSSQFAEVFPELKNQQDFVGKVIQEEEASFLRTLENGIKIFEEELKRSNTDGSGAEISGEVAFKLYDTYGFPIDLTLLLSKEKNASVDLNIFNEFLEGQKTRSRSAAAQETGDWVVLIEKENVIFTGYDELETSSRILKYREVKTRNKKFYQLVLDKTPFYPEGGGQQGDTGYLQNDEEKIKIIDTKKENDLIVHYSEQLPQKLQATFKSVVDAKKRSLTESNHSATHLLHAALRQVQGNHVQQKGSLVSESVLRFDFSHFAKMSPSEIQQVEKIVNERIRENILLDEKRQVPIEEAKRMGAMALFGEKYGDTVRVITFNPSYSVELCGGTHIKATGQIGFFKIISESSVAAGVRRIEAITNEAAEKFINEQLQNLEAIREILKNPADLKGSVESLINEKNRLHKEIENIHQREAAGMKNELIAQSQIVEGVNVIIQKVKLPNADSLKKLAFEIKQQLETVILVLAAEIEGKPQIAVVISDDLVKAKGLNAGNMVRHLAKEIQGGGGGQPFFATAGGKDLNGLTRVIIESENLINDYLQNKN